MERMVYLKDVVTLALDPELCLGCGVCLEVCPQGVLEMREKKAAVAHRDACMECGACMENCPGGAIRVEAGVGCANAVINSALGIKGGDCCCSVDVKKGPSCC